VLGHVEAEAVGEEAAGVNKSEGSVFERLVIKLESGEAVGLKLKARGVEMDGVFEVAVLGLEMVRAQVHSFGPDNAREVFHERIRRRGRHRTLTSPRDMSS
jgi:hypothetical protein